MGRIIDLRDPDTYTPYSVYKECIEMARVGLQKLILKLQTELNGKLSVIGAKIIFDDMEVNGRTRVEISSVINGVRSKMHTSYLSSGDDLEKDAKMCYERIVNNYFGIS